MKNKKIKSLQKKLTFRVILIASVILVIAVIASQMSSNASFWKSTEESLLLSASTGSNEIKSVLDEATTMLTTLAADLPYIDYNNRDILQDYLKNQRDRNNIISEIFAGFTDTNKYVDGAGWITPEGWELKTRPWYMSTINNPGVTYNNPYLAISNGMMYACIGVQMKNEQGQVIGVVCEDLILDSLVEICGSFTISGTSGKAFLLDSEGAILAHDNSDFMPYGENDQAVSTSYDSIGIKVKSIVYEDANKGIKLVKAIDYDGKEKYIATKVLSDSKWTFGFAVPISDFVKKQNNVSVMIVYTVVIVVALIFIWFATQILLIRPIKPISEIIRTAKQLAIGAVPDEIHISTDDDLGVLADDFNKLIISTKEQVDALTKMSNGDFTIKVSPKSQDDILSNAINQVVDNIEDLVRSISASSNQVAFSASQLSEGSQTLSQSSTQQAEAIEELSSTIATVATQTGENANMAKRAEGLTVNIKRRADVGGQQMEEMMRAVNEISEASQSIGKVIKVIDDIAFQTNILALNAAVEAARAGQYGKGFAVVAEEVRNLAAKSAEAAKDTSGLISNSIEKALMGSKIAEETAQSLNEIVNGIGESNTIVGQISKYSEEQSNAIIQINAGIEQVVQAIQQNTAVSQESASSSEELSAESQNLEQLVSQFKFNELNQTKKKINIHNSGMKDASNKGILKLPKHGNLGKY